MQASEIVPGDGNQPGYLPEREEPSEDMPEKEEPTYRGKERDVMQLWLRDGPALQAVIRGLQGPHRGLIEEILERMSQKGKERDVMQITEESQALDPGLYRALNHLMCHRPSYLADLVNLVQEQYDWRELPPPSSF